MLSHRVLVFTPYDRIALEASKLDFNARQTQSNTDARRLQASVAHMCVSACA